MRRIKDYLRRLPVGLYGLLCGLFVFVTLTAVGVAEGKRLGDALMLGLAGGLVGAFTAATGRNHRAGWRKRFASRFAKPS